MTPEVIIADDITGAGDSGVHFALAGRRAVLLFDRAALAETLGECDAAAISSESRFLSPDLAAAAVREAAKDVLRAGGRVAFKKIDSTLRGNPGAEIEAVLDAAGHDAALVCVAMPKTGRTCRDGVLLVHGEPVGETEGGRDPFNPVTHSAVADILATQTRLPIGVIGLDIVRSGGAGLRSAVSDMVASGRRIVVADAVADADLAALGKLLRDSRAPDKPENLPRLLPVGAGGLAEAYSGGARAPGGPRPHGRMLAVIGSLTGVAAAQARYAEEHGDFRVLELDMEAALRDSGAETSRLADEAAADERDLLLRNRIRPGPTAGIGAEAGIRAAGIFGMAAKALCRAGGCSVLYVTGGGTAVAVAAALGLARLVLERECLPGVVLGSCPSADNGPLWFISKAGGFGAPDTIVKLASGIHRPE